MITYMRPCRRCAKRHDCSRRTGVLSAVSTSPVPISLVNFRCDWRLADLPPGAVAIAKLPRLEFDPGNGCDSPAGYHSPFGFAQEDRVEARVVVMEEARGKSAAGRLRCYAPEHGRGKAARFPILHLYPDQLAPTGERVAACRGCGRPMDAPVPPDEFSETGGSPFFSECGERGEHVGPQGAAD